MKQLTVSLGERSYPICFGSIDRDETLELLQSALRGRGVLVVTDRNVDTACPDIWGRFGGTRYVFPAGERSKTLQTVMNICGAAAENELDRQSVFVAVGGGVTGDLTGFAASMFMRGVSFVQVPTTLLAMVDSSVGGKTAANLPEGKNLVGSFHQPKLVLIDVDFLRTLPWKELRNGMAEVVKYGVILDEDFFSLLEKRSGDFFRLPLDMALYEEVILHSCRLKAEVVAADETEKGLRAVLNFGHTFGHAFELLSLYQMSHGEAVAAGMSVAAKLAGNIGLCSPEVGARLDALLKKLDIPDTFPKAFKSATVLLAMLHDKKNRDGKIRLVLPERLGHVVLRDDVPDREILRALDEKRA